MHMETCAHVVGRAILACNMQPAGLNSSSCARALILDGEEIRPEAHDGNTVQTRYRHLAATMRITWRNRRGNTAQEHKLSERRLAHGISTCYGLITVADSTTPHL